MTFRGFGWLFGGLIPIYLVLAAVLPPADDEFYYWCWSKRLQLSYYDHPPMTAYMIWVATQVFGDTLFAIRLPAVVSTLTVLGVIGWLTRPRNLLPLVVFTPLFTFGAVLVTPDTPLLMFWSLYVLWLVAVHERLAGNKPEPQPEKQGPTRGAQEAQSPTGPAVPLWLWLLGGLVLGCGILGKYTTGLAAMAGFVSFLFAKNWRKWVFGYAVHMSIAFIVTLPILIHNVRYDFVPLQYQWKHSMSSPQPGVIPFLSFVGIQLLLFGVLPFGVFVWTVINRAAILADPRLRVCACLFWLPFAFFLYKATRGPLEGNWALACYISVWPLAAAWYERARRLSLWRWLTPAAFAVPAGAVIVLAVHLVWPLPPLSPHRDRITRQIGKEEVAQHLAETLQQLGANEPVYVPSYQWAALLRFYRIDARQIEGITRPSHFTQFPERLDDRDHAFVFSEGFLTPEYVAKFNERRILKRFPLIVRGEEVGVFWLLEYSRSDELSNRSAAASKGSPLDQPRSSGSP